MNFEPRAWMREVVTDAVDAAYAAGMARDGQIADERWPIDLKGQDDPGQPLLYRRYWHAVRRLALALRKTGPVHHDGFTFELTCRDVLRVQPCPLEGAADAWLTPEPPGLPPRRLDT